VREAMANGGIYVVALADEARELIQETAVGCAREAPAGARSTAFGWARASKDNGEI
jgi:hypothetical protein